MVNIIIVNVVILVPSWALEFLKYSLVRWHYYHQVMVTPYLQGDEANGFTRFNFYLEESLMAQWKP